MLNASSIARNRLVCTAHPFSSFGWLGFVVSEHPSTVLSRKPRHGHDNAPGNTHDDDVSGIWGQVPDDEGGEESEVGYVDCQGGLAVEDMVHWEGGACGCGNTGWRERWSAWTGGTE